MSRFSFSLKSSLLGIALLALPVFAYLIWHSSSPTTLSTLDTYQEAGQGVKQDFQSLPSLPLTETDEAYQIEDTTKDGIDIQFANQGESLTQGEAKKGLNLSFPKDYSKPIDIKLDDQRGISITDLGGKDDYTVDTLTGETAQQDRDQNDGFFKRLLSLRHSMSQSEEEKQSYLRYTSKDQRKSLLYAYQKDQATGEKKLKHWTLYQTGDGMEHEEYQIDNAKVKINQEGVAEVFYYGDKDIQNEQVKAEVDSNLLERAQRTLAKEMGEDLLNGNNTPDFTIPKPYYLDREGNKHDAEWKWHEETKSLSVNFQPESYPVALDPTLSFTAPGMSNTGSVITGEMNGSSFGRELVAGDFNADGRIDLAVGTSGYSSNAGRAYIFYNDGAIATTAASADVIITGNATDDYFGASVTSGDFNADGKTDLAVAAYKYSSNTGRVYIFHNDGSIPTTATTADVTITGNATFDYFGASLSTGDFNADGRTDLIVGAFGYSAGGGTGRVYIFHNDGSIPTTATTADVTITGNATGDVFGTSLATGDLNSDGKPDLIIGASSYATNTGRAYIFYNDGSIPTTAATADVTITGETTNNYFGYSFITGDFNADGRIDLAVGAYGYSTNTGRAYIFYNDGSIPATATTADVTITGEASSSFGSPLVSGDFNADDKTDLAIGARRYSSFTGRAYIFYNDGSIPTTAATADVIITGQTTDSYFGVSVLAADLNADGRTDLVVDANGNSSPLVLSRTYIFYSQNGQVNTNQNITGEATGDNFGEALTTGDLNNDGRMDLIVGARAYGGSDTGRVYIFYGDGQIPSTAATADVTITSGGGTSDYFGRALVTGDFNVDGKTDLAVGADGYLTQTGRVYIFYGDGSIPTTAGTADVTITGESTSNYFGYALTAGDLNSDGETDLAVGAYGYSGNTGRAYIFHNDGSIPTTAATADVTITGGTINNFFGDPLTSGDFNADGRTDLAVGASGYSSDTGRAYIFHNDGSIPTTAATADVTITGGTSGDLFGIALAPGDFNTDGKTDLAVGASDYSSSTGRAYIFHNDGSIPTTAATADVTITGETTTTSFGSSIISGDFNSDGRTDLVVSASLYSSNTGRAYIFHNDGSIPTTAATADVTITGETTSNFFGRALGAGDMNGDGRVDLIVGALGYSSSTGRVYLYETRENFAWQIQKQPQLGSGELRTGLNTSGQELKITGEESSLFGYSMTTGDFNSDGKTDLAVGAYDYSSTTGRIYIFHSDGSLATGATNADIIITGETGIGFGIALVSGDFNSDGRIDIVVGADHSLSTGGVYVFYNDGSLPTTAATADVTITGEASFNYFGRSFTVGDFNSDGRTDLAVGASGYSSATGRAYIFYNDGSIPTTAGTADVTITGTSSNDDFGWTLTSGDFNADGTTDLAVGARGYSSFTGRVYIFHNDGSIPTTAGTADITITGSANDYLGYHLTAGDFNSDGRIDLAAGAIGASSFAGRVFIFYNDGTIPTTSGTADVTITGDTSSLSGAIIISGDFNADGRTDLAVGAGGYSTNTGRAHIYYNDGSLPTTAATADVTLTGEATNNYFGSSLASGDWNADGKIDLAVGAPYYSSSAGRVYVYTFGNDPVITGETTSNQFGTSLLSGDFNADGRVDLVVGAERYSTYTGRAYIFYNDGSIPSAAASADVTITGPSTNDRFGHALAGADLNNDGTTDLVVSAYSNGAGTVHIFYNDGSIPTTAGTADITITGTTSSDQFGWALVVGDFNTDGETDLAVGANGYSAGAATGRAYIFHNDGSIPTTAGTADVTITGDANSFFGDSLAAGDFNTDGRMDLAVGAEGPSTYAGAVYIFHNDGSIPTTTGTADVTITGTSSNDQFGISITSGDFNADGRIDLAVGALGHSTNTGRAYVFYNDGSIPTTAATADVTITGETTSNYFSYPLAAGDFNADGRTDLVAGASGYATNTGRAYVFYNDGSIPTTAATADVTLTGEVSLDYFASAFTFGDFNSDGKIDLAVGSPSYSTNTGRTYIFASEAAATSTPPGVMNMKGTRTIKGSFKVK